MDALIIDESTGMQPSAVLPTVDKADLHYTNGNHAPQSRHTMLTDAPVVRFRITLDSGLLHQYYQLRTAMFVREWHLSHFPKGADSYDFCSDTLIAHVDRLCVGGLRMTFSTPDDPKMLPMEDEQFNLAELLPELDLKNKRYAECTRLTLLPDFRKPEVSFLLRSHLFRHCIQNKMDYLFWISPLSLARSYRQTPMQLGFPCQVRMDIPVPEREEYEDIKMYLTVVKISDLVNDIPSPQQKHSLSENA